MISRETSENEQDLADAAKASPTKKKSKKTDLADNLLKIEVDELKDDFLKHKNIVSIETEYLKMAVEEIKDILFSKSDKSVAQQIGKEIEACRIKISEIENIKLDQI